MVRNLLELTVAGGLLIAAVPGLAHHAFDAEYDRSKQREFKGTVTKVEWLNPHARVYLDVIEPSGKMVNWEFELGSPNGLMRAGWTRYSLKKGDIVTVIGYLSKDGSNLANARDIVLSDGRRVFTGSSADFGKQ
jgi:Family of unknown function (DUF6152)